MSELDHPRQNQLLAMLPEPEYARVSSLLERVEMECGDALCEPDESLRYVYFPVTGVIAELYFTENGASRELALIGNEGMLGISLFMGGESIPYQALVVMPGYAYRLRRSLVDEEIGRIGGQHSGLQGVLLRYTQALLTHMTQIAACKRHHSIEQQFSRWLLMILDRQSGSEIAITQQSIASLLGVRREGITEVAGKLQQAGVIRYCRGQISVLERAGLEAQSCECYPIIKNEFARLLAVSANPSPLSKPITAITTYGHAKDLRRRYAFG
ncbi:Crp/Fnr family transcriptional regulator [Methylomonas sp. BW4-1]|uniref:Crp/Fnr family transcriptional regulator n=1 Tax=Methylomonas defluvii TaxID=3045149 RepID=A0ABU4UK98_9GAMM|nr:MULTISPECIES: Crp/Fnr family transcriptional regulator [unclassified Methylomonas]MDX8129917.1 Crp/Fnr family transcriptional regulator [Methylomonas sp. OY6]PKD38620.1 Crp/Fnr family transcriptional regulator [Methylomonas sp. Kb3]QBC28592.1 Crp/Fnr family transcriptional regulator [Methylomonas sp. LW13]